jgi:outer membrane biosynthesis protein TonB
MITAEFIIGRSADDAVERKQEVRKIFWALLAALLIHLVIGYLLASFHDVLFSKTVPVEEEKPVELTIVDLPKPAPAAPKNAMFMETEESKQSAEPKEKTFESNANSIGATQVPASGDAPLPSQQGKDRPVVDLETHSYSLANRGAQPQPNARPQESASVAPSAQPTSTPLPDQLAMLRATPTPVPSARPSAAVRPQPPSSVYRPQKDQTRISGSISNRGISSVNALGTPLGRYEKILKDAIGSRWYAYMDARRDLTNIGTLQVHFFIDRRGQVKNLKITENTSNEAFANICLQAILEAQLPPIPDDVASTLPSEGLEIEGMNFIIYPN